MKQITWITKEVPVDKIDPTPINYKIKSDLGRERLKLSLKKFGLAGNIVVNYAPKGRYVVVDGNSRLEQLKERKVKKALVSLPSRKLSEKEFKEMSAMFDFAKAGEVDVDRIEKDLGTTKDFFDRWGLAVPLAVLDSIGKQSIVAGDFSEEKEAKKEEVKKLVLRDKFIEPPFSVLDGRNGNWQARKAEWLKLGIRSEIGRDTDSTKKKLTYAIPLKKYGDMDEYYSKDSQALNTSIFDPALCELIYTWFCPKGGNVLDAFAGGSVRGIVAQYLGFGYVGVELSRKQVDANRKQGVEILKKDNQPLWISGDSRQVLKEVKSKKKGDKFDFLFTCPPYANLEVYSNDPRDLSNMSYKDFLAAYREIISLQLDLLKPKRYAAIVVSEVRDKKGNYLGLVKDTIQAFTDAGAYFYNDAVLINMVGSASMRADRQFSAGRKLVRVHQNVLIFYKP